MSLAPAHGLPKLHPRFHPHLPCSHYRRFRGHLQLRPFRHLFFQSFAPYPLGLFTTRRALFAPSCATRHLVANSRLFAVPSRHPLLAAVGTLRARAVGASIFRSRNATARDTRRGGSAGGGVAYGVLQPPLLVALLREKRLDARDILPATLGVLKAALPSRVLSRLSFLFCFVFADIHEVVRDRGRKKIGGVARRRRGEGGKRDREGVPKRGQKTVGAEIRREGGGGGRGGTHDVS